MITVHDVLTILKQTRLETMDIIQHLNLEDVVYVSSGWRVHDIITHLTWSDEQAVSIIDGHLSDKVYRPPAHLSIQSRYDVHRRNAWIRRQRFTKNPQEVMTEFVQAHEALKTAITRAGTMRMHEEFSVYWGDRITVHTLAIWQIQHDQQHQRDLARCIGYPNTLDNRVYRLVYSQV